CTFARVHGPSTLIEIVGGPLLVPVLPAPPPPAGDDESTLTCLRRLRWSMPAAAAAFAICWGAVTYWIEIWGLESGVEVSTEAPPGVKGWPRYTEAVAADCFVAPLTPWRNTSATAATTERTITYHRLMARRKYSVTRTSPAGCGGGDVTRKGSLGSPIGASFGHPSPPRGARRPLRLLAALRPRARPRARRARPRGHPVDVRVRPRRCSRAGRIRGARTLLPAQQRDAGRRPAAPGREGRRARRRPAPAALGPAPRAPRRRPRAVGRPAAGRADVLPPPARVRDPGGLHRARPGAERRRRRPQALRGRHGALVRAGDLPQRLGPRRARRAVRRRARPGAGHPPRRVRLPDGARAGRAA